jgi:hypothetical protein
MLLLGNGQRSSPDVESISTIGALLPPGDNDYEYWQSEIMQILPWHRCGDLAVVYIADGEFFACHGGRPA